MCQRLRPPRQGSRGRQDKFLVALLACQLVEYKRANSEEAHNKK